MYDESIKHSAEGLRAMEADYFKRHYDYEFMTKPADDAEAKEWIDYTANILKQERDIEIAAAPVEASQLFVDGIKWTHVFYANGLGINVLYTLEGTKRAVGFKLSEGMEVPEELATKFKFASMKSKLAGSVRGSFFVIKGEY